MNEAETIMHNKKLRNMGMEERQIALEMLKSEKDDNIIQRKNDINLSSLCVKSEEQQTIRRNLEILNALRKNDNLKDSINSEVDKKITFFIEKLK